MRPAVFNVAIYLTALASASTAGSQLAEAQPRLAKVDAIMSAAIPQDGPGCAVGVSRNGKPLHLAGYGMANLLESEPITPDTSFNVASVSKQFTGYAITLLEQEGRLSLADSVRVYIPELPGFADSVTIAHLLHHTAGVPNFEALLRLKGELGDGTIKPEVRLAYLSALSAWNQPAGSAYEYSNTGYFLLAQIVARVSGQSFPEFLEDRVFGPRRMTRSMVLDAVRTGRGNAVPYDVNANGEYKVGQGIQTGEGPSGVQMSVRDLLLWGASQLKSQGVNGEANRRMREAGTLGNGNPLGYGRGLRIDRSFGETSYGHQGSILSYRSDFRVWPKSKLVVAVTCNRGDITPWFLADRIAEVALGKANTTTAPENAAIRHDLGEKINFEPVEGLYHDPILHRFVEVAPDGKGGFGLVQGRLLYPLNAESAGVFRARMKGNYEYDLRVGFSRHGDDGAKMVLRSFMEPSYYRTVNRWSPPSTSDFSGRYCNSELDLCVDLESQGSSLLLKSEHYSTELSAMFEGVFANPSIGGGVQFKDDDGKWQRSFELWLPVFRGARFFRQADISPSVKDSVKR
jgi:CubicO group peptidase (beta-lactamase class C family)